MMRLRVLVVLSTVLALAVGVSTATGISCSNGVPVDVRILTMCASPATQG